MSIIKIRGRADLIIRPYHIAKMIKQRKFGDDTVSPPIQKVAPDALCDLGDEWCGTYGQIISIELNDKPRPPQIEERQRPLTPEEIKSQRKFLDLMREDLERKGILKKKDGENPNKLSLTRSGLNEYKAKFGKEYEVPAGAEVIEDL